jgi:hypothetical protein
MSETSITLSAEAPTYGQAAAGNYIRMPFNRCNLGSEQGLIDDPVLGQGRDPLAPLQDVINDDGDIVAPVDPRYLGLWLTGLFGDPDTTDNLDGSWDHEFASGGDDLPSYTVEVGMAKVPAFFGHAGSSSTRSRWSSPDQARRPRPSMLSLRVRARSRSPTTSMGHEVASQQRQVAGLQRALSLCGPGGPLQDQRAKICDGISGPATLPFV